MSAFRRGEKAAADELIEILYPELRRLARARLQREPDGHSWQPTLLVNELYLELLKIKALPYPETDINGNDKSRFFGLAAFLMKRLLTQHARPLAARAVKVELKESAVNLRLESVTDIEIALTRLSVIRPRLREIVELKVFEGMTLQEVASQLNCSTSTVTREWNFIQHWLREELPVLK